MSVQPNLLEFSTNDGERPSTTIAGTRHDEVVVLLAVGVSDSLAAPICSALESLTVLDDHGRFAANWHVGVVHRSRTIRGHQTAIVAARGQSARAPSNVDFEQVGRFDARARDQALQVEDVMRRFAAKFGPIRGGGRFG